MAETFGFRRSGPACESRLARLRTTGHSMVNGKSHAPRELSLDLGDEGSLRVTLKGKMAQSGSVHSKCKALIAAVATTSRS